MKSVKFSLVEFHEIDFLPPFYYNIFVEYHDFGGGMVVCFIGHRKIPDAKQVRSKLIGVVAALIGEGADTFLFGSRSEFDFLCWEAVTKLKEQYPHLKRICYHVPHETVFTSREERERSEFFFSNMGENEVHYTDYEESVSASKAQRAHKNVYVMRNQEMIERSDVCVFYYDRNYLPPKRKQSKRSVSEYQPKSGTALAYAYAKQKKKRILNLYQM